MDRRPACSGASGRDAGECVLLPVVPPLEERQHLAPRRHVAPRQRRPPWRWAAAPLAAAAALLLVVRLSAPGPEPDRPRGGGIIVDSSGVGDSAPADSAPATTPDTSPLLTGVDPGALVALRATPEGLVVRLAASSPQLGPLQVRALHSAVTVLQREPTSRAVIRYVDPSFNHGSESWRLATRAADRLARGGIESERIRWVRVQAVDTVGLPPHLEAVEVVVHGP